MEIKLTFVSGGGTHGDLTIPDAVVHFGRHVPEGRRGVVLLDGENISDHHGKIIYAHNAYRYVNLTERPTEVFRGESFLFELNPAMPSCTVVEGDRLKLGTAMVQITSLVPPVIIPPKKTLPAARRDVTYRAMDCGDCQPDRACQIDQLTSSLIFRLREYTRQHEILRASVDWLGELFLGRKGLKRGRRFGRPESIVLWPREDAVPLWEDFGKPIPDRPGDEEAHRLREIPGGQLDLGRAFLICDGREKPIGIGAGIIEEITLVDQSHGASYPRAGHYIVMHYPANRRPTPDDLCLLQHAAVNISAFLASIEVARIRRQQEFESRAGREAEGVFHDMRNCCQSASRTIEAILENVGDQPRAEITRTLGFLAMLAECIERGEDLFDLNRQPRLTCVDVPKLCQGVLNLLFPSRQSLRQTRDWCVTEVPPPRPELHTMVGDPWAIRRVLQNLVRNAKRALADRQDSLLVRRVHLLLDTVRQYDLLYARIRVADDGCGLDEPALQTLFQGHFTTQGRGHGVGSQVVADLVRRHYGFLELASARGLGTVVGVLLPLPLLPEKEPLEHLNDALAPYRECFNEHNPIRACDLKLLFAEDNVVKDWYHRQGENDDRGPACG